MFFLAPVPFDIINMSKSQNNCTNGGHRIKLNLKAQNEIIANKTELEAFFPVRSENGPRQFAAQ